MEGEGAGGRRLGGAGGAGPCEAVLLQVLLGAAQFCVGGAEDADLVATAGTHRYERSAVGCVEHRGAHRSSPDHVVAQRRTSLGGAGI